MKKLPTLHILNGDASLPAFKAANLPGQVLVWREILSEGPAIGLLPEQEFWQKRQAYITQTYGESAAAYKEKVLDELQKLEAAGAFFEVVLWFDTDLMCQVNLLYLLHSMHKGQPKNVSVCTPAQSHSISKLNAEEMQQLFEERKRQTAAALAQAHELWSLYAGPDPKKLQEYVKQITLHNPYLQHSVLLHLSRFPNCKNGLGADEKALLQLIQDGADTKEQLLQQFWQRHPEYGYGDWQLLQLLKRLQPELVNEGENLEITSLGEAILEGKAEATPAIRWLGSTKTTTTNTWCYNSEKKQLQISSCG